MRILVACEESQAVTIEMRRLGHEAYSCDIQECSGGHPEWHLQQDVIPLLTEKWDMIIAHPPCTYLTVSGNRWFNVERYGAKAIERARNREEAARFFMAFVEADAPCIAIENPIGWMNTHYRKPDQIIQPYQFGHPYTKQTCLWLKGLPKLVPTEILQKPEGGVAESALHQGRTICRIWQQVGMQTGRTLASIRRSRGCEGTQQDIPRHRQGDGRTVGREG